MDLALCSVLAVHTESTVTEKVKQRMPGSGTFPPGHTSKLKPFKALDVFASAAAVLVDQVFISHQEQGEQHRSFLFQEKRPQRSIPLWTLGSFSQDGFIKRSHNKHINGSLDKPQIKLNFIF